VKVTGGHQAKLNDKSVLMAFIGYEMGSKTYRFYNPRTRRVCVTWDTVFMEERWWDWSKYMCDEEAGGFGTFSVGSIIVAGCHGHGHVGVMPVPDTPTLSPRMQAYREAALPLSPVALVSPRQGEPVVPQSGDPNLDVDCDGAV
jgi:hypothetical protein